MISFHTHSHFSVLQGTIRIPDLIEAARKWGSPYVSLTDTNGMYGLIQFAKEAEETGLKPLSIHRYDKKGKYIYDKGAVEDRNFYGQTFTLYSVRVDSARIKLDELEHEGFKWVDFDTAMLKLTWPNQRQSLEIVHKRLTREKD